MKNADTTQRSVPNGEKRRAQLRSARAGSHANLADGSERSDSIVYQRRRESEIKWKKPMVSPQLDIISYIGDRDLLFAILARIIPWVQASQASDDLLKHFGSLVDVLAAPESDIVLFGKIDVGAASMLKAINAAALHLIVAPLKTGSVISKWSELEAYLTAAMARHPFEEVRSLLLDSRNRLISDEIIASGGPRGVIPDSRTMVRRAVQLHASAVIVVHNHPSGDPLPSPEDIATTSALSEAFGAVGIVLHDHIIVSRGGLASFRRLGLLGG